MWGNPGLWAGWCRPDAERAWRVFLPLVAPGGTPQPWSIRKGGVWWLRRREREGVVEVLLECVKAPGQP